MFVSFQLVGRVTGLEVTRTRAAWNVINNRVVIVLYVLAALASPAIAAEAISTPSMQAEFGAKLLVCNACHGDSLPKNATIPILWGQQENYLVKQLHDFQSGERESEVMSWMATTLSQTEQGAAADYFAKKNWPVRSARAAATSPPATVAVCEICHQQNFAGGLAGPRLAGQTYEYLVEAMRRFAEGERTNNADMMKIMAAIPPAERESMARYISGL
jgi:cytochrome c553